MADTAPETKQSQRPPPATALRTVFGVALAIQVLAALVVVFDDFGVDHERFGPDLGQFPLPATVWLLWTGAGFVAALCMRRLGLFVLQGLVACAIVGVVLLTTGI